LKQRQCDILVVGGGVAGVPAAVAAARLGLRVILAEQNGFLGGAGVTGLHRHICGLYGDDPATAAATLNAGLAREVALALAPGRRHAPVQMGRVWVLPYSTGNFQSLYEDLAGGERRLDVLPNARAVAVRRNGRRLRSVTVAEGCRHTEISAKVFVDCTGDAAVARQSRAACRVAGTRARQLAGFTVRVGGLVGDDPLLPIKVPYGLAQAVRGRELPGHFKYTAFSRGQGNDGYCKFSFPSRERDVARARAAAGLALRILARDLPAFRAAKVLEYSPQILQREGPALLGRYALTARDILKARKFPDGVVRNAWPIELWEHGQGPVYRYPPAGDSYEIPARCLRARDVDNLYSAGRCISASRAALGSTRVMGACIALGEAAARLAAQSLLGRSLDKSCAIR
jgi:hypothetical protein